MKRKVKIHVSGRVQGVFFRQSTQDKAHELGILGTARNLEDGRVEIIALADNTRLEPFIEWCRQGPKAAKVDNLEIIDADVIDNEFTGFKII